VRDCVFCKIAAGESPAKTVFRDEQVTAFHDIHPVSPIHILITPNRRIASVNQLTEEDEALMGHLFTTAKRIARRKASPKAPIPFGDDDANL
jgi:histidine triad (HIT) family protein